MPIKNPKDLLIGATKYPLAIEGMLPEAAPKLSTTLTDLAEKLPALPDLPIELPDLPEAPTMPAITPPTGLRRFVTGVEVRPTPTPTVARKPLGEEILS